MSARPRVRTFRRDDRDQLTDLVNSHLSVVVPGARLSVNSVLGSLERQPDEHVVDPWVVERATFVVESRHRVVGAAHLHRFTAGPEASDDYRDAGLVQWLLVTPPDDEDPEQSTEARSAADALTAACHAQLAAWQVRVAYADGQLPFAGVYGVPEQWPHVREALVRAGFRPGEHAETVLLAPTSALPHALPVPDDVALRRTLGPGGGVRFTAHRGTETAAYVEIDTTLGRAERQAATGGTAELVDLSPGPGSDDALLAGVLAEARAWLELAGVHRVLVGTDATDHEEIAQLRAWGFRELTTVSRGWQLAAPNVVR
ncbi:hypothetical protein SAMN05518682_1096 [Cellulosimicrobium aquatile]|uniref:Uncharacterized protein n=1 Tax=Cellulosimicrobium aquatile TaxID=1612203 RepID=A0A1N6PT61_9MICO|nr:hypothetical protein [Cellulosimicrobium aquatile]SIQ07462.1 hypothetical protein SAMN05518682_1096 [Cellulosimicrobium aquatile]